MAESEIIGANHLGFAKFLFQQYSQQLGLNSNHYPAKSAFNYYINDKITDCLGGTVNIESARENFYTELFQHTSLPRNYSFTPIIREINQIIERYIQQQFSITYADKGKGRIQTPAVTPKRIQLPGWKKHRVELPTTPSYHYIPGSTINILSVNMSTLNMTLIFGRFQFQSKQWKEDLLRPYAATSTIKSANPTVTRTTLATTTATTTTTAAITTTKHKPNGLRTYCQTIPYFLKETANSWYQSLAARSQTFQQFKTAFLEYFSNNNSINCLANTFTTIKQNNTEAVTTYLECFHKVLCQIQAINAVYFTEPQILNQFICGLHSSILQHVRPLHPANLQATITHARDFELAELKANHTQTVNLIMNGSSDLDSKLKQIRKQELFPKSVTSIVIIQSAMAARDACLPQLAKLKHLPANDAAANLLSTNISDFSLLTAATSNISTAAIHNISTTPTSNLSISNHSNTTPKLTSTWNPKTENNTTKLKIGDGCLPTDLQLHSRNSGTDTTQNLNSQNYLSLLVTSEDITPNNPEPNPIQKLTSNAAIFLFEFEKTTPVLLFSGTTLEEKLITAMYTNAKVDGHSIKLILDSGSAGIDRAASAHIITADRATKTPISKIDNFPFKINGIIIPIKYQAFIGNDWLFKTNAMLDWTTQKLQLSQNGQHTRVPATCGHFKLSNIRTTTLLIKFKKEENKPMWKVYQVLWTKVDHNELPPILSWNDNNNEKRKQRAELTWETDNLT
ncbi:hypothetical protein G9A89_012488 [Geosiphon pyriformis]|nr:hypothetical protein G9A89_012488 [Geosiphon pyriformis]